MRLLLLTLFACTGVQKDDTGAPADTDADTDADSDTDTDTDTDTDPRDGEISGMVLLPDGSPAAGMEVQVCATVCYYATTDASGNFSKSGLEAGLFKVDAIGAVYDQPGYGNALYGVDLEASENVAISPALVVPPVEGPVEIHEDAASDTYDLGQVSLTFAASEMDLPFGAADSETGMFPLYGGVLEGDAIPELWSVTPSFVVSFLPWATEVGGPMDLVVEGLSAADGSYEVYSLEEYGAVEGPLGTATVSGGTATVTGIRPSVWTWLMFVPAT